MSTSIVTKQQVLAQLATLDVNTLQKLYALSDKIFTPEEDQLVNVTFSQMVEKAHNLANVYFPTWTDRSKSDFGEFLVEIFALFSEKDFWYLNAFANEPFLQKASLYSNVYLNALKLGYKARLFQSAEAKFRLTFQAGADIQINVGEIVVGDDIKFSNVQPVFIPANVASVDVVITMKQGVYQSDTRDFNGRSVRIATAAIDVGSVSQVINGIQWERVNSFAKSSATDKVFMVLPSQNGNVEIVYGYGGFGLRPALNDTITTTFRTPVGDNGNLPAGTVLAVSQFPNGRTLLTVQQMTDGINGQDGEDIEELRNNAAIDFRLKNGVINPSDCIIRLEQYPDIKKANAFVYANTMYFQIIPVTGIAADQNYLNRVLERFKDDVTGPFDVTGVPTVYQGTSLNITAYALTGVDPAVIEAELRDFTYSFTDPLLDAVFGRGFNRSDFLLKAQQVIPALQNIVFNDVCGQGNVDVGVNPNQIMARIDANDLVITVVN